MYLAGRLAQNVKWCLSMSYHIKAIIIFVSLVFGFISCQSQTIEPLNAARVPRAPLAEDPRCVEVNEDGICKSYSMSIFELLANSEKYHNKIIALGGYVIFKFEGNALYATKVHYIYGLAKDAIWLDVNGLNLGKHSDFREGYAYISGVFDRNDGGHFRIFSGALKGIDWLQPINQSK